MRPLLRAGLRFVLVVLVAVAAAGCAPSHEAPFVPDAERAQALARSFYGSLDRGGAAVTDVVVENVALTTVGDRNVWRVEIRGRVAVAGQPSGYVSAMILEIDALTGNVRIFAQG